MAQVVWVKDGTGTWVPAQPNVKNVNGWLPATFIKQKTGSTTWSTIWARDTTPPGHAAVALGYNSTTNHKMHVVYVAPSDADVANLLIKVSTSGYPTSTSTTDSSFVSASPPGMSRPWSVVPTAASAPGSMDYPVVGTATPGVTYYVTVWAQDTSFNYSAPVTASFKIPVAPVVTPPTTKSAYFTTTDSGSYSDSSNSWRTDNNYVYQGGQDWRGLWFYSTKVRSALAKASKITRMEVYITRANTAHGVTGHSNIWLIAHRLASQSGGDPIGYMTAPIQDGALLRGESGWANIPSTWWPSFVSGAYLGVGMRYNDTSYTDVNYMYAYGAGTNSGKLYIEWTE